IVGMAERLRPRAHGNVDTEAIVKEMLRHYPDGDGELVRRAYTYATEAHEGQKRISGEPYITHPAAVAMLIAELGMDPATIAAPRGSDDGDLRAAHAPPRQLADQVGARGPRVQVPRAGAIQGARRAAGRAAAGARALHRPGHEDARVRAREGRCPGRALRSRQ